MAGAGYKLFTTGSVLTAADVNTYLNEQTVMVFNNATARTTALSGVLAEGMVSYLKDTNATEVYDGSAWVGIGNSGDITGVTAGTGISGGGTSGTVTITNDMATTITAAGDIVVGTGSGTYDNLPIGTTGQVLTADTTVSPYKVKWATAGGGGKVAQIVSATYATATTIATTSLTDTGLTATITPTSSGNKILVFVNQPAFFSRDANRIPGSRVAIDRGGTKIYDSGATTSYIQNGTLPTTGAVTYMDLAINFALQYMDSPATTSSTTYKFQMAVNSTSNNSQIVTCNGSHQASIILMEVEV